MNVVSKQESTTNYWVAACKIRVYHEAELLVDAFSYSASTEGDTVSLRPGDTRLEQSIRLGYIHFQTQQQLRFYNRSDEVDGPAASLQDLSRHVYDAIGRNMVIRHERPFPRYVLAFPQNMEKLITPFRNDGLFKEDVNYIAGVARDQYVRPGELLRCQLANNLTVFDVVKIRRFLNFLRELMAHKLVPLLQTDPSLALRSLLPVFDKDGFRDLLSQCVSEDAANAFLRIATYDREAARRVFDVQYQPLVRGEDYYLVPMNVLCSSDVLRNLLFVERRRLFDDGADSPMQHLVAEALRKRFRYVAEGANSASMAGCSR